MQLEAETYKDYLSRLRKLSIQELGSGSFGTVFQHPEFSNVAVKVVRKDAAYLKFVKFAIDHPTNKYLPRIAAVDKVKFDNGPDGYLVFMERLSQADFAVKEEFFNKLPYELHSTVYRLSKEGWALLSKSKDHDVAIVAQYMLKNWANLDLTDQNLMQRGRQLVFSDPVA